MSRPGAWASIRPARDAARDQHRLRRTNPAGSAGGTTARTAGGFPWRMDLNERGDLVAVHDSGTVRVIATAEEGTS